MRTDRRRGAHKWVARVGVILLCLAAVGVVADALYLIWIWPDWDDIAAGPVPKSQLIADYERDSEGAGPRLRWRVVHLGQISTAIRTAVVASEDTTFLQHAGFDWDAIELAAKYNIEHRRIAFGASTISQQTVKNLFLGNQRTWLRKWHEIFLTWGLERNLDKSRILTIYLNTVELGRGVFGMESGALAYFGKPAAAVGVDEAAELAATLPSPKKHNPQTRTRSFLRRKERVLRFLRARGWVPPSEVSLPPGDELEPEEPWSLFDDIDEEEDDPSDQADSNSEIIGGEESVHGDSADDGPADDGSASEPPASAQQHELPEGATRIGGGGEDPSSSGSANGDLGSARQGEHDPQAGGGSQSGDGAQGSVSGGEPDGPTQTDAAPEP